MPRPLAELNEIASGTLTQNMDMFQNGACRLFARWANACVHCRREPDGSVGRPLVQTVEQMISCYPSLSEWACEEQCLEEDLEAVALSPFRYRLSFQKASTTSIHRRIETAVHWSHFHEDDDFPPVWALGVTYFHEAMLQHIVAVQGWNEEDFAAWTGSAGQDQPTMEVLAQVLEHVSPSAAMEEALNERFPSVPEIRPPRPRANGYAVGLAS